ncbi:hypothetical protein BH10BAC5_BH10BAC5_26530 [soil metagenome]
MINPRPKGRANKNRIIKSDLTGKRNCQVNYYGESGQLINMKTQKTIFLITGLLIFFLSSISFSQNLLQKYDGITFNLPTGVSMAPFNGGIDNARFQFIDIDNDGLLDLFTYDKDTTLYFYKNIGTPSNANFKLITQHYQNLNFKYWFYFVDMDSDGDYDLFTGSDDQKVRYYKNTGTPFTASFNLQISELHTSGDTIIYHEANNVPVFTDIDGDGLVDFFSGQALGKITYYKNIGSNSNFNFKFITDFWQNILIISPASDLRHGSNSLEFTTLYGNGKKDLYWGDLFSHGIYEIRNMGTQANPNMVITDSTYPHNQPFISDGYNSTRFYDINNDGKKDLFISSLYPSQNKSNFVYYQNNGTASSPLFQRVTTNYLNNIDVGGNSSLAFVDINNNGLKDLYIGNDYGKIAHYKNTGTSVLPQFTFDTDSIGLGISGFDFAPAFGDVTGDGLQDLFVGSYRQDSLYYFKNTGTAANPVFTLTARGTQLGITNIGQDNTPFLADIDADGDLDLFIGNSSGKISFYRNTGSSSNFNFQFVTNNYLGSSINFQSIPRFYDIDRDGDLDLFVGKQDGTITFYRNDGTTQNANFIFVTNNYNNINVFGNSCPSFVDIDSDSDGDLFVGNVKGGLYYWENRDIVGVNNISNIIPSSFSLYQNYPNPFNPQTSIRFDLLRNSKVKLSIFSVTGKVIAVLINDELLTAGTKEIIFDAGNISSGIYYYKLETEGFSESKKMVVVK